MKSWCRQLNTLEWSISIVPTTIRIFITLLPTAYTKLTAICHVTQSITAWKVYKYEVFSGPYFPVLSRNVGKYGLEKTLYLDTFHAVNLLDIWILCKYVIPKNNQNITVGLSIHIKPTGSSGGCCSSASFNIGIVIWKGSWSNSKHDVLHFKFTSMAKTKTFCKFLCPQDCSTKYFIQKVKTNNISKLALRYFAYNRLEYIL